MDGRGAAGEAPAVAVAQEVPADAVLLARFVVGDELIRVKPLKPMAPLLAAACVILLGTGVISESAQALAAPTFNREVAPFLFANCVNCHRPGEIAPMPLLTYQD